MVGDGQRKIALPLRAARNDGRRETVSRKQKGVKGKWVGEK